MFDFATMPNLHPPLPPALPPLAIERPWDGGAAISPEAYARLIVESYAKSIIAWERDIVASREKAAAMAADTGGMTPAMFAASERVITFIEALAEKKAIEAARFRKKTERKIKQAMREDPAKGAVSKILADGLNELNDRVIQRLLDDALIFRALHAEHDPDARGGPVFDDPDELEKFLLADVA